MTIPIPDPYEFGSNDEWMAACEKAEADYRKSHPDLIDCSGCGIPIEPEDLTSDKLCGSCRKAEGNRSDRRREE